mmetsp:Transcript_7761/g.11494  ORF Transcript_7761/g.11494 Transcript_7761/m.11494 type:complete len:100 (-) Transcript_7761:180-479(-)
MPVGDVLVGDTGCDVEHNDGALALDVVSIAEPSEFLLSGRIPHVEFDGSTVGVEDEGMDLDSQSGNVLLFELTGKMALHERGLSDSTISDEDELEFRYF